MDKQAFLQRATALQATYQPNEKVKAHLSRVDLLAIVGPTGVGKTSIMIQSGIPYIPSDVSRPKRNDEKDGVECNFRSDYDQLLAEIERGEFAQYLIGRNGEFYGTKGTAYPVEGVCTMAVIAGILPEIQKTGFRKVVPIYIVPPSYEEWMRRVGTHQDADIEKRLMEAKESLQAALDSDGFSFIVNDKLEDAVEHFKVLARGEPVADNGGQAGRIVAEQLLAELTALRG